MPEMYFFKCGQWQVDDLTPPAARIVLDFEKNREG